MRLAGFSPTSPKSRRSRIGFTLVELMVAMALSLFLMTILAEAFAVSMDTFRGLRAIGDMQDTLRNGLRQLREDLSMAHFEGGRKLSDPGFWTEPRREGFFLMRGTAIPASVGPGSATNPSASYYEGDDGNLLKSTRATDHLLHFAVRRQGYRPTSFFSVGPFYTPSPDGTTLPKPPMSQAPSHITAMNYTPETYYGQVNNPSTNANPPPPKPYAYVNSQWAEIAYFLLPMTGSTVNETVPGSVNPLQLYNLYRAQVLVLPYRDNVAMGGLGSMLDGTSTGAAALRMSNNSLNYYSPNDIARGTRGFSPNNPNSVQYSLVCTNVISFQVRTLFQKRVIQVGANPLNPPQTFVDFYDNILIQDPTIRPAATIETATQTPPTWADPTQASPYYRMMGVQIRLRIYDAGSGQARQNTLVQAL